MPQKMLIRKTEELAKASSPHWYTVSLKGQY